MRKYFFIFYAIGTVLILLFMYFTRDGKLIEEGPGSFFPLTLMIIALAWLGIGAISFIYNNFVTKGKLKLTILIVFSLIFAFYLNNTRESHLAPWGDFGYYYKAAEKIHNNVSISIYYENAEKTSNSGYIYPPFLAIILSPLGVLGLGSAYALFKTFNVLLICIGFILLYKFLLDCKFPSEIALGLVLINALINVPADRTVIYGQVNFLILDLVLAAFLLYKKDSMIRIVFASLFLAIAAHLKLIPVLLIIPFIFIKDFKFIIIFIMWSLLIFASTLNITGFQVYGDFLEMAKIITGGSLRDTSFESFFKYSIRFFTGEMPPSVTVRNLAFIGKLVVLILGGTALFKSYLRDKDNLFTFSYFVILFVSIFLSPRVWPHIYIMTTPLIFLSLAYLPAKKIILWIIVYTSFFLIPVFDIYPLSYHRLLCFIIFLCMLLNLKKNDEESILDWIKRYKNKDLTGF